MPIVGSYSIFFMERSDSSYLYRTNTHPKKNSAKWIHIIKDYFILYDISPPPLLTITPGFSSVFTILFLRKSARYPTINRPFVFGRPFSRFIHCIFLYDKKIGEHPIRRFGGMVSKILLISVSYLLSLLSLGLFLASLPTVFLLELIETVFSNIFHRSHDTTERTPGMTSVT